MEFMAAFRYNYIWKGDTPMRHKLNLFTYICICLLTCFAFFPHTDTYAAESEYTEAEQNWFLNDINAADGWSLLSSPKYNFDTPTIVAVIDTGCDYTHPLIKDNLFVNTAELNGEDGVDDDGNGYTDDIYGINTYNHTSDPTDDSTGSIKGHGTHVAGTILRTAGVTETSNPFNIKIMIIKAGDSYGNFSSQNVAEALRYAADNGASVINMSLSSLKSPAALQDALSYASKSAILVASAGNQGKPTTDSGYSSCADYYPAAYPYVIGVMSYDADHRLSYFSNWDFKQYSGAEYDIAAPGNNIYSCYYDSSYRMMKGTSMSAGVVSGCAALLCAKWKNSSVYSPAELTSLIMESGKNNISHTDIYGHTYTYKSIDMSSLLSENISPNLILSTTELSGTEDCDGSFTLKYTLLNRGSNIDIISTYVSAPDTYTISATHSSEHSEMLYSLDSYDGVFTINFENRIPENEKINLILHTTVKEGSDISDIKDYSFDYPVTVYIGNASSPDTPTIPLQGITLSASDKITMTSGSSTKLNVSYIPPNTTDDKTVVFTSSNTDCINISSDGTITAISPGVAAINATSSKGHTRTITVIVCSPAKINIADMNVILSSKTFNWDNRVKKPSVTIDGLNAGTDFTVRYSDKHSKNIGKYTITVSGTGKYTGSITRHYYIVAFHKKTYRVNGLKYKVTSATSFSRKSTGTVTLTGSASNDLNDLRISLYIKIGGKPYRVTAIKKNAFINCKNIRKITILPFSASATQ